MALFGGIDKRAVAAGAEAIEGELRAKITPLRERGGYVPHLDHLFGEEIPCAHALHYLDLKARLCGVA